ncbi:MAG: hypothetical protein C3F12_01910 [Candidatus Methylomirabilota bacterium]|nr:DUF309 domain-containing protein [Candidatus Methylomirabilis sp.]NJD67746.1 DUF309 domain-containing protein [candidate division NC10 bacterium]PWB48538.1 MAG: hypothetical protein C3F12_01910 [candidate division NC10 bacterium]
MRTIPPPIRSVELRDQLSELLREALQMESLAGSPYLLRSFEDMVSGRRQPALVEQLRAELSAVADRIDAYCRVLQRVSQPRRHSAASVEEALEKAAHLFNEGLFFEVHEVLEAVWLTQHERVRPLLQGLIQIAVGFHHLENNNLRGSLLLLKEGIEKVKGYGSDRSALELDQFLAQVERARESIESLGEAAFDLFDRRMIPTMPFDRVSRWT